MKKILVLLIYSFSFVIYGQEINDINKAEILRDSNPSKANLNLMQSQIRNQNKWEFGLAKSTGYTDGLRFQYNVFSSFSFGYSHFHSKEMNASQSPWAVFPSGFANINFETKNSRELGLLNFKYYLFERFPFYLTGGLGRNFIGANVKNTFLVYNDSYPAYLYSKTEIHFDPVNYYFYGLGFQWNFINGLFVGFEFLELKALNQSKKHVNILAVDSFDGVSRAAFFSLISIYKGNDLQNVRILIPNV